MNMSGFTFSQGNMKLGNIWNFSLPPIVTCMKGVPCAKSNGCYAHKAYQLYPSVRKAWGDNLRLLRKRDGLYRFREAANELLYKTEPRYFRIHTAGDFYSAEYLETWRKIAGDNPHTKFLAYTKRLDIWQIQMSVPVNLIIRISTWPGWIPTRSLPCLDTLSKAHIDDGQEAWKAHAKICKDQYFLCPGSCEKCKRCWNDPRDVVFKKH